MKTTHETTVTAFSAAQLHPVGATKLPFVRYTKGEKVPNEWTDVARLPARLARSIPSGAVGFPATNWGVTACPPEMAEFQGNTFAGAALRAAGFSDPLSQLHAEHLSKWIPQDGEAPLWYAAEDLDTSKWRTAPLEPLIFDWLASVVGEVTEEDLQGWVEPVKVGTNHGDPTWGNDLLDHAAHLLMAAQVREVSDIERLYRQVVNIVDRGDLPLVPVATTFSRTGHIRKAVKLGILTQSGPEYVAEVGGVFPRRRHVRGVPTWLNEAVRAAYRVSQERLKAAGPWYNHTTFDATHDYIEDRRRAGLDVVLSDDASSFDSSVSGALMEQWFQHWRVPPRIKELVHWRDRKSVV